MTKGIWRKQTINGLAVAVPVGAESVEVLRSYKDGDEFISETRGARNIKQLKLFWALVDLVVDATDKTKTDVKKSLATDLKYIDIWVDMQGNTHVEPQSISPEKMTQAVFNDFFKSATQVIAGWLETSPNAIRERHAEMMAEKRYEGMRRG
jgi:hypothetical protein